MQNNLAMHKSETKTNIFLKISKKEKQTVVSSITALDLL